MEQPQVTPAIEAMTAQLGGEQEGRKIQCCCVIIHPGETPETARDRCGIPTSIDQPWCEGCEKQHRNRPGFGSVPLHLLQQERAKK